MPVKVYPFFSSVSDLTVILTKRKHSSLSLAVAAIADHLLSLKRGTNPN